MIISPSAFRLLGLELVWGSRNNQPPCRTERKAKEELIFQSSFGVSCDVCSHVWEHLFLKGKLKGKQQQKAKPAHLLWCLMFFKAYDNEIFLSSVLGTTEKTYRKWVWYIAIAISSLYDDIVSSLIYFSFKLVLTLSSNTIIILCCFYL